MFFARYKKAPEEYVFALGLFDVADAHAIDETNISWKMPFWNVAMTIRLRRCQAQDCLLHESFSPTPALDARLFSVLLKLAGLGPACRWTWCAPNRAAVEQDTRCKLKFKVAGWRPHTLWILLWTIYLSILSLSLSPSLQNHLMCILYIATCFKYI